MFPDKVYLASNSPRRLELLQSAFKSVEKIISTVEEPRWHEGEGAHHYLERCLEAKSRGAKGAFEAINAPFGSEKTAKNLVVSADTIVVLNDEIFGKPESPEGAFQMLSRLMGKTHEVLTGYSLSLFESQKSGNKLLAEKSEILSTKVTFRKPTSKELWAYVKTGEPMDKSGSYGVQGPALQFVQKVEGSYLSVMGLPIAVLSEQVALWQKKFS